MTEYGRYNPALDEGSVPVESTVTQAIYYQMPDNAGDKIGETESDTKTTSEIERYGKPID